MHPRKSKNVRLVEIDAHVGVTGFLRVFRYGVEVFVKTEPLAKRGGEKCELCRILFFLRMSLQLVSPFHTGKASLLSQTAEPFM